MVGYIAVHRGRLTSRAWTIIQRQLPTGRLPALPSPPATGKKKGRKTAAGGGGVLGKLGLKKGRGEGAEEEAPGAGTAGSPRYIQVWLGCG